MKGSVTFLKLSTWIHIRMLRDFLDGKVVKSRVDSRSTQDLIWSWFQQICENHVCIFITSSSWNLWTDDVDTVYIFIHNISIINFIIFLSNIPATHVCFLVCLKGLSVAEPSSSIEIQGESFNHQECHWGWLKILWFNHYLFPKQYMYMYVHVSCIPWELSTSKTQTFGGFLVLPPPSGHRARRCQFDTLVGNWHPRWTWYDMVYVSHKTTENHPKPINIIKVCRGKSMNICGISWFGCGFVAQNSKKLVVRPQTLPLHQDRQTFGCQWVWSRWSRPECIGEKEKKTSQKPSNRSQTV